MDILQDEESKKQQLTEQLRYSSVDLALKKTMQPLKGRPFPDPETSQRALLVNLMTTSALWYKALS
jgi:hypothetical protein